MYLPQYFVPKMMELNNTCLAVLQNVCLDPENCSIPNLNMIRMIIYSWIFSCMFLTWRSNCDSISPTCHKSAPRMKFKLCICNKM